MTLLEEIQDIIDTEGLNVKCRNRDVLYRRYYIMWFLRENKMSTIKIGRLFNKDHATVLNALKRHYELTDKRFPDKIYRHTVEDLAEAFSGKMLESDYTSNIYEDIMNAKCLADFNFIQKRLKKGYYGDQNVCTFVSDRAADTSETDQKVGE